MYNYKEAIKADVKEWMQDNHEAGQEMYLEFDYDTVFESCWVDDSVTGNASGSYTFSRYEARENFFGDSDSEEYISDMIDEGFISAEEVGKRVASSDWEYLDVCIRCYLLGEAVQACLNELEY